MSICGKGVRVLCANGGFRRVVFNGLFSCALFLTSANASPTEANFPGSHAFSVRSPFATLDKVTPLHVVHLQELNDAAGVNAAVQAALNATSLMPQGKRVMLNVDLDFMAIAGSSVTVTDADDNAAQVMTADGSLLPDRGIWLEQGASIVRQRVSDFFTIYRQAGGEVDFVMLDYQGLSLSADELKTLAEASGSVAEYLAGVEADARFADLQAQLGFADLLSMYAGDEQASQRQQQWNAVMKQRMAGYLQQAFYQPLALSFPQAQVSARDFYQQTTDFSIPDSDFGNTTGALAGNAQGLSISGALPVDGLQIDGKPYAATAFNAFRYETNRLRAMALSSGEPLFPLLAGKNQPDASAGMSALLTGSDLYQEMVIHAALSGARQFVYQNQNAPAAEESLLDKTLQAVDQHLGVAAATPSADNLVDWQQPFVLSAASGETGKVWRFTPQLDDYTAIDSVPRQQQPAIFKVGDVRVTVPAARMETLDGSVSTQGFWLTESADTSVMGCALPVASGQECVAYYAGDVSSVQASLILEKAAPVLDSAGVASILFTKNWKSGGPDAGVGKDHFTAQYNVSYDFPAGVYQFAVKADDAVRLWVDGELLLDGTATDVTASRILMGDAPLSGVHALRLEYTDLGGEAAVELGAQRLTNELPSSEPDDCSVVPTGEFCGQFFANKTLAGDFAAIQHTDKINFNWGNGKPLDELPADNFSARWVGEFSFEEGAYTFVTTADDGVRVWLDDELQVDAWKDQAPTTYRKSVLIPAGLHRVKMEYYERGGGAVAQLDWSKNISCEAIPENAFCAEYFNNKELLDNPAKIQNDPAINFDWKDGAPVEGVNADNFSVRWQGDFDLAGNYRFVAKADDRMRVWVDGKVVLDLWDSNDAQEHFQDMPLSAGKHRIKVEMREFGGNARAIVFWEQRQDCEGVPDNAFCGSFFDGSELEGDVKRTQSTTAIDFDWGTERPMHGVKSDVFSARWVGNFDFPESAYYRFFGEMDDGVRVWVDDELVVDQWSSDWRWPGKAQAVPYIEAGKHVIKVEYRERYGAAYVRLGWRQVEGCGTESPEDAFCLTLFNNKELSGIPSQATKTLPSIHYEWNSDQPDPMVWKDNFSARWVGKVRFEEATYRFVTDIDEGARIWVDGELVLDAWGRVSPYYGKYRRLKHMTAGLHEVKVEYYEGGGTATAKVFWEKAPDCGSVPEGKFCATFHDGKDLTAAPVDTRMDDAINFDWGSEAALPGYLKDNFAVSWVGDFDFAEGRHTFRATADDGVRVWLDEQLLIDAWKDQGATTYQQTIPVTEGKHRVRMDYYERSGGAVAKLDWVKNIGCASIPTGEYCAEYFNNNSLTGDPAKIQNDPAINFEWQDKAPVAEVNADNFSARWVGDFDFAAGDYRFVAKADDRMRVWVDGQVVLDLWDSNDAQEHFQDMPLSAGKHRIKVEMRELGGWARAKFFWEQRHDCEGVPDNAFCGSFFDGDALAGAAKRTQLTDALNFDWGTDRPMHGVNSEMFSARWEGRFDFPESAYYRFSGAMDDGVRVWIDGQQVIDQWSSDWRWPGKTQAVPFIEAGQHVVKVEYRERYGAAALQLGWEQVEGCGAAAPDDAFCMMYFDNTDLSGIPRQVLKTAPEIAYDWADTQPDPMVWNSSYSVRWLGNISFEDGLYRFVTELDDGARIWVDDELVLDGWNPQWPWYGKLRTLRHITAGKHLVKVEYRESWGNALAKVSWEKAPDCDSSIPNGQFCTAFYNGTGLQGAPLDTRLDDAIQFDWGYNSPNPNVPGDNFSTRWVGNFDLAEGEYTFTVRTDDGFRLWVDGANLIDSWKPQGPTTYTRRIFLTAGTHAIKAEYYEASGGAVAEMSWKADQLAQPQTPANLKVASVSQTAVNLTWDAQTLASAYRVYRDGTLLGEVTGAAYTDTTVLVTRTYEYGVTALWPNGRESLPAKLGVTVADTEAPGMPVAVAVTSVGTDSISLGWQPASDNVGVVKYQIWRDGLLAGESAAASFVDSGLGSYSRHHYSVIALDAAGNASAPSVPLTAYTQDGTAPSVPQNIQAVAAKGQVSLSWQPASDNVGITAYRILRDGLQVGQSAASSFTDNSVQQDTAYSYQVVAVDVAGNVSAPSEPVSLTSGDTTAPDAPANLTASADTARMQVALSWDASADNVGVAQYRILRDGRLLALSNRAAYTDTDVQAGNTYTYTVKALDSAGNASLPASMVEASLSTICETTQLYYKQHVESRVSNCASCHIAGGMGQNSRFILTNGADASERNLNVLDGLVQALGKDAIVAKASGQVAHGGGAVLPTGSEGLNLFSGLLDQLADPQSCDASANEGTGPAVLTESMAANCASCHGSNGVSSGPATPSIAGMGSHYLSTLMRDYQTGKRASTVMGRIATGYNAEEIDRLTKFFAEQPFVVNEQTTDAALVERGQTLHQQYCASCHTASGRNDSLTGVRLAGQWKPYLLATLDDFASQRSQAPTGMANQLSVMLAAEGEGSLTALAEFYASAQQDTALPEQPDFVEVAAYTPTGVTLTWMDSSDDWGVSYYEIYRDGVLIGQTAYNSFTDTGLAAGGYRYTVVAVDAAGNRSVVSDETQANLSSEDVAPEGMQLLDYKSTLRKAAILLLNRTPTETELAAVNSEEDFRVTLRAMLDVEGALNRFVYRAGHEVFLSNGAARANSGNGIRVEDFPALANLTDAEKNIVSDTIRKEPVFLMEHIVDKDRPWTEILTADYTVLNAGLAKALGAETLESFRNPDDPNELRPARIPQLSARMPDKPFPHAGVLTTNAWLSRFPTTDTNRNRHRSANVYKQFMGLDIEALAQRPLNDSGNGSFRVPTMENPNCMVCHTVMDPVAGAFKNWGNEARYFQNFNGTSGDKDSLSRSYKSSGYPLNHLEQQWFHKGDTWYRDMLMPGFNGKLMPGGFGNYGEETWATTANLLENPSAESGLAGWNVKTGAAVATNKASCNRVTYAPKAGSSLFMMGLCDQKVDESWLYQDIDISSHSEVVDQGKALVNFGAYLRTKGNGDIPSVWVSFLAADGAALGESPILLDTIGWTWGNKTAEQAVPQGTYTLRFNMRGARSTYRWADPYLDAYIDSVFMTLKTPAQNVAVDQELQDSLQWLAKHLTEDQRFAKGGVYFWYRTLFKREPLAAPVDPAAEGYAEKMAAFNEQDALLSTLARQFQQDHGHGAWNVKDLLAGMIASPLFRADAAYLDEAGKLAVPDMGIARLLTPEEINGKLTSLLGTEWRPFTPDRAWSDRMGLFYGGFDGGSLQKTPNTEMNTLMSKIPERMAIELSCNAVYNDFKLAAGERRLLGFVEAGDTPTLEEIGAGEANMLLNPGAESGMANWTLEQGTARILSGAPGCDGGPSIHSGAAIFNPGGICKNQSNLATLYQDVDVTNWAGQVDSGQARAIYGAAVRAWSTNNDEASVYLSFRDASGTEIGAAPALSNVRGEWQVLSSAITLPANTRVIRFYMQGRNLNSHPNNDAFVDDAYLRVVAAGSDYMTTGEKRIRANIQFLHKHLLNEELALDSEEIDRTYRLFSEVQADASGEGSTACRLYSNWEDPQRTKRAWSIVMMYLLTDARFLYE